MHWQFGYTSATEGMHGEDINFFSTDAIGASLISVDFQMELHLEIDNEQVVGTAVGGYTAAHANNGPRAGWNEKLTEHQLESGASNHIQGSTPLQAGLLFEPISGALEGAKFEEVIDGIRTFSGSTNEGNRGQEFEEVCKKDGGSVASSEEEAGQGEWEEVWWFVLGKGETILSIP